MKLTAENLVKTFFLTLIILASAVLIYGFVTGEAQVNNIPLG